MYFPIDDILNDTTFGIPKNNSEDLDSIIQNIITTSENEA